ncbi:uncharacterized protein LOC34623011 [Cyclospora cayetanensis]|uniref:Uncharacterized protein LOC34623011 n=2 Tax=Cyclospora cayetanensis TaxID=88456 RepID=A0A6P5WCD0_9EIME|nr:uncharacterized protein LOC34623011 [Cyclospora cayetanensis]OEH74818.1 hypothetical protein cyc_06961 [Cyclospora cayetanensis]
MVRASQGLAALFAAAVAASPYGSLASDGLQEETLNDAELYGGGTLEQRANLNPGSLEVQVAEIQGMPESDLKLELRSLYSPSKDAQKKQIYPPGCLEAMQDLLNTFSSIDEEQRDTQQYMNRFAYLLGQLLERYNDFFSVKVKLGDPKLGREAYKEEAAKLPQLAAQWTLANELLVGYLKLGAKDMRDKWDQAATTEKRLRDVSSFFDALIEVYEAQQQLFRAGYLLAQLRYMQFPDRQADLTLLMEDPRQRQAVKDFEDALENIREKTHQARRAAFPSVQNGFLASEYLALLPFPPDKQREMDDLPRDEM